MTEAEAERLSQNRPQGSPASTASIDRLYHWLIALSLQVRVPEHVAGRIEDTIREYANKLTAWPAPTVKSLLEGWPSRHDWWPTWHELEDTLPDPASLRPKLTDGGSISSETFSERMQRLGVRGKRLAAIGVAHYGGLVGSHRTMNDDHLLASLAQLERREW